MRSPLNLPLAEPLAEQPATKSVPTREPAAARPRLSLPDGAELQEQPDGGYHQAMIEAMDKAASRMIAILNDTTKTFDLKAQMEAFKMCQDWLVRRAKLKPPEDEGASGVDLLRARTDPVALIASFEDDERFAAEMQRRGWLSPPAKKNGRPSRQEAQERAAYEARRRQIDGDPPADDNADDSALRARLGRLGGDLK